MGIPHRLIVGDRGLKDGVVEYANRSTGDSENLSVGDVVSVISGRVNKEI